VSVVRLVTVGTVECDIARLAQKKTALAEALGGGGGDRSSVVDRFGSDDAGVSFQKLLAQALSLHTGSIAPVMLG
jgi:SNF2 family DNA or RNA helicase